MKNRQCMGIWMDHSHAYLMELKSDVINTNCIVSESLLQEDENNIDVNNIHLDFNNLHKAELQQRSNYYHKIGECIRNYQQVLLFGPTDAKNELYNILEANHLFDGIEIEKKDTDTMTENEMHALVKEYFQH